MKKGDRVKGIRFPKDDKYNPVGIKGTIVSLYGKYQPIIVEWDNGIRNSYPESKLEKA
jgi:hypothetical protein